MGSQLEDAVLSYLKALGPHEVGSLRVKLQLTADRIAFRQERDVAIDRPVRDRLSQLGDPNPPPT